MTQQILDFKNNLPNLTVLRIFSQDISVVKPKLEQKIKQAPMMFVGMQLIIDLSEFDSEENLGLDIKEVLIYLQSVGVRPIAVMTARASLRKKFANTGLGVLPVLRSGLAKPHNEGGQQNNQSNQNERTEQKIEKDDANEGPRKTYDSPSDSHSEKPVPTNLIIRQPVRSGQRIYTRGDLTIVGSVSQGAEVIAEGSIHVYGALRGRALAGAQGDDKSGVFCRDFDSELVSIAGNYRQMDEVAKKFRNQSVQISLENEKICFFPL